MVLINFFDGLLKKLRFFIVFDFTTKKMIFDPNLLRQITHFQNGLCDSDLNFCQKLGLYERAGAKSSLYSLGGTKYDSCDTSSTSSESTNSRCENLIDYAALSGRLKIIKWVYINCIDDSSYQPIENAASSGHLDIIMWLYNNVDPWFSSDAMDYAAENGDLNTLKWLHNKSKQHCMNDYCCTRDAMKGAACNGNLEIVKWLYENCNEDHRLTGYIVEPASKCGHLNILIWAHKNTPVFIESCIQYVSENGHLHILEWLYVNKIKHGYINTIDYAASNGHLKAVKWLHFHNYGKCTKNAMTWAAQHGHLDVVKWLHKNRKEGCRPKDIIGFAIIFKHWDIVKWMYKNYHKGDPEPTLQWIKKNEHLGDEVLQNIPKHLKFK